MSSIHTTLKKQIVPLENIDYIGELETGQMWDDNYKIYLKPGTCVAVSSGRNYIELKNDRQELVDKFIKFLNHKP